MRRTIEINSYPQSLECLSIRDSLVGSLGVFTSEDIPDFMCIEIAKAVIFPTGIYHHSLKTSMETGIHPKSLVIDQYVIGWSADQVCIPLGNVSMYNHSDTPNCEFIKLTETGCVGIVTVKPIKADEELTVSYGATWFDSKWYVDKVIL